MRSIGVGGGGGVGVASFLSKYRVSIERDYLVEALECGGFDLRRPTFSITERVLGTWF